MKLYLDTAALIYYVEQVAPFAALVRQRLEQADVEIVASELIRLECRVKPLRDGNHSLLEDFDDYLSYGVNELVPISRESLEKAAQLRAKYVWLKTPDAIHLAAAIESGSESFLTNDRRLERCTEIKVEVLAA